MHINVYTANIFIYMYTVIEMLYAQVYYMSFIIHTVVAVLYMEYYNNHTTLPSNISICH